MHVQRNVSADVRTGFANAEDRGKSFASSAHELSAEVSGLRPSYIASTQTRRLLSQGATIMSLSPAMEDSPVIITDGSELFYLHGKREHPQCAPKYNRRKCPQSRRRRFVKSTHPLPQNRQVCLCPPSMISDAILPYGVFSLSFS